MGRKGWTILIATVAAAIIGAVIGYLCFASQRSNPRWTLALAQSRAGRISRRRRADSVARRSVRVGALIQGCPRRIVMEDE
jgi:hypothetical protein